VILFRNITWVNKLTIARRKSDANMHVFQYKKLKLKLKLKKKIETGAALL